MTSVVVGLFIFFGLYIIWWNLPVKVNRYVDIQQGRKIIEDIELFQSRNNRLPEDDDWQSLRKMNFDTANHFLRPEYSKLNDTTYELIFVEGFDPPYLLWNSNQKEWKMGNPTYLNTRRKN